MANWNNIDELRQIFIDKYTTSKLSTELEKACSEEYELMRDYNGRQILELLQNVDDALIDCTDKDKSIVHIKYVDNILEVGNTGTTFNADTIERLCLGRASSKSSENIGNKGTGFRSLLNDSEWIEVHSGNFAIRFSKDYSKRLFDKYNDVHSPNYNELINEQLKNWKKEYPLCFPIMNCPEQIEKVETRFDTLIRIKINESNIDKTTSIQKQLSMPFYKSILFLPNISKIIVETKNSTLEYEKCEDDKNDYKDVFIQDDKRNIEHYYLFNKKVKIFSEKYANLIIAYPVESNHNIANEKLYCYFPIRNFQTPIHAIIHAPFITNSSRDDVPNDNEQINYLIFKEIAIFIKEVAEKLKHLKDTNPIEFVTPINFYSNKMWDKDYFNLRDYYLGILCDSQIIPTVNDKYISINDVPKILKNDYPNELVGSGFEKLVKKKLDSNTYNFIKEMSSKKGIINDFDPSELLSAINNHSDNYNLETAIDIFLWWSKYYKNFGYVPNLLKDTNNNWITKDTKIFLPTNDGISILGESLNWVKLCVLKPEYASLLTDVIKKRDGDGWKKIENKYSAERTNDKRLLDAYSDSMLALNFIEQSSSRVIISEMTNQVDNVEKAKLFFNWFFVNYKDKITIDSELAKLRYKLPDRQGILQDTKNMYFGIEYNNQLADKVFSKDKYFALCSMSSIYTGDETNEFYEFLKISGVLSYPKYRKFSLNEIDCSYEFKAYVKSKYRFTMNINYLETYSIENFKKLLEELSTKEVVELITKDESLSTLIFTNEKLSSARQQSNWSSQYFNSNEYVLYTLNNTRWIEIEGKKYAPNEIIKYGKLKNKIENIFGIQEKDLIALLDENIVRRYNLDFKDDFSCFSDNQILEFLKLLPHFDTGEISRKLYIDLIKNKKDVSPTYEPSNLKLIAKDGLFHTNSELVYVDKSIPQIIDNCKKIDIPIQQSTETIKKWLGVKRVDSNLELFNYKEMESFNEFYDEIKDIKLCTLAILEETTNYINKIKRLKVVPCTEIIALDKANNSKLAINEYSFINNKGKVYISLPTNKLEAMRKNHNYAMCLIEILKESISPQIPMDLIELLINKNHKEKRIKIEEKYGIDKWNSCYESLFEKSNILKMLETFFKTNNLDKEMLNKLAGIDFSTNLEDEDFSILFDCLKKINKDICDINSIHDTIKIDAREYIRKLCVNYLNSNREKYRISCFNFLKDKTIIEKQKYLSMAREFDNYDFSDIEFNNSIVFSFDEILKVKFPLFDTNASNLKNLDEIYNENHRKCINKDNVNQEDFDCYIEDNIKIKSLLYFDDFEYVTNSFIDQEKVKNERIDVSKYDNSMENDNCKTKTIKTILVAQENRCEKVREYIHNGEMGIRKSIELSESNEKAGKEAENIAYLELKKEYPNLIWHSKYSQYPADKNKLPPNNIVCDMWSCSDLKCKYFEIKSSITEFEMTINEYESMKKNQNDYFVVLVNRESKEISKHQFFELDSLKEPSKYKFIFKQIKE